MDNISLNEVRIQSLLVKEQEQPQGATPRPPDTVQQDNTPDGGYGWVCVACVFWINAHTWGINGVCSSLDQLSYNITRFIAFHALLTGLPLPDIWRLSLLLSLQ
jgi:hypothetical protein